MRFLRATVDSAVAIAVVSVLLLNVGVFAYPARAAGAQTPPSPADQEHEHSTTSAHTTETTTQESTSTPSQGQGDENDRGNGNDNQGEDQGGHLHFTLFAPSSTSQEKDDKGQATITISGTTINVDISVKKVNPSTTFSVVLVAVPITATTTTTSSGSSTTVFHTTSGSSAVIASSASTTTSCVGSIGTFVTDGEGEGEVELSTTLAAGTYALSLVLCSNNLPVLLSHPGAIKAVVGRCAEANEEDSGDEKNCAKTTTSTTTTMFTTTMPGTTVFSTTMTTTTETDDHGDKVNPVHENGHDDDAIKTAMSDKTIPAVISVFNSDSTVNQLDSRFSVAASKLSGNGLMISISAQNVTGSRVLLVNLTGGQWSVSNLQALKVVFDGAQISQAASLTQVLNATPGDPARYIIMLTSTGLQLLVSIPHFSLHTIELIPTPSAAPGPNYAPFEEAAIAGVLVLAVLSVALYSRKRGLVRPRPARLT